MQTEFNQKRINHIFHYTPRYEYLLKILRNGFAPSYCLETINEQNFFIPMVSFCNIPIKDVDHYMHYGKYGIGMSMDWAVRNEISPVIYLHENTPFKKIYDIIYNLSAQQYIKKAFHDSLRNKSDGKLNKEDYPITENQIIDLNDVSFRITQFLKNWKTKHNGNDIITYQEREWRYIPNLDDKPRLISEKDKNFKLYSDKNKMKKPHLPEESLEIIKISDIRYLTVKKSNQRQELIDLLVKKFSKKEVENALVSGRLFILTERQLHDDF